MDKITVNSLIEGLKSSNAAKVLDSMVKIRTKVITSDHGMQLLRERNGLAMLVELLRKPNERILDATLSVLGNCCLNEDNILAVGQLNIAQSLVLILKSMSKDSIIGRSCRLMGNLAQDMANAEQFHNAGAVVALISTIESADSSTTYPTRIMAVRALRLLWMVKNRRSDMLQSGAVRSVTMLLISECESVKLIKPLNNMQPSAETKKGAEKAREDLFIGMLKCLVLFTGISDFQCAEQVQGDGRGYWCLVALAKDHPTLALHCISNLCHIHTARPVLGTAGAVECLVEYLVKIPDVDMWPNYCALAVSYFCRESVNRQRLRHGSGLKLLLAAARSPKHARHALPALLQFVFDDIGFQILLNEGLIALVIEELKKYLLTMKTEHKCDVITPDLNVTCEMSKSFDHTDDLTKKLINLSPSARTGTLSKSKKRVSSKVDVFKGSTFASDSEWSDLEEDGKYTVKRRKIASETLFEQESRIPFSLFRDYNDRAVGMHSRSSVPGSSCTTRSSRGDQSPWWQYYDSHSSSFSPDSSSHHSKPESSIGNWSPFIGSLLGASDAGTRRRRRVSQTGLATGVNPPSQAGTKRVKLHFTCGLECSILPVRRRSRLNYSPSSIPSVCSSPQSSDFDRESSDSEQSGHYSPVCSDMEDEKSVDLVSICGSSQSATESIINNPLDIDDIMDFGILQTEKECLVESLEGEDTQDGATEFAEPSPMFVGSKTHISCVLVLLSRISHTTPISKSSLRTILIQQSPTMKPSQPTTPDSPTDNMNQVSADTIITKEFLDALVEYITKCKKPLGRASRILLRLISSPLNLIRLLQNNCAQKIHEIGNKSEYKLKMCDLCKQLRVLSTKLQMQLKIMAESEYGIGEISYQLLKGTAEMKQILTASAPYIISSFRPLQKILIECKLLDMLISSCDETFATAFSRLAQNLKIRNPKTMLCNSMFKDKIYLNYDPFLDDITSENMISFKLDDMSIIEANKTFLAQQSDVFNAMLMGNFKESTEKYVRLPLVSRTAFEYLLTLLHCGFNNEKEEKKTFPLPENLETALETLLIADRFLFENIHSALRAAIVTFKMTPYSADRIYMWSLNDGMGILCFESLAYILTASMSGHERSTLFGNILRTKYRQQWIDDIEDILLQHSRVRNQSC